MTFLQTSNQRYVKLDFCCRAVQMAIGKQRSKKHITQNLFIDRFNLVLSAAFFYPIKLAKVIEQNEH